MADTLEKKTDTATKPKRVRRKSVDAPSPAVRASIEQDDIFFAAAAYSRDLARSGHAHCPNAVTTELVRIWAEVGTSHNIIARELGIDPDTLVKYYGEELENAEGKGVARVAQTLFNKAMRGDTAAMIFYLKTKGRRTGWIDKEDEAPAGGATQLDVVQAVLQTVQSLTSAARGQPTTLPPHARMIEHTKPVTLKPAAIERVLSDLDDGSDLL